MVNLETSAPSPETNLAEVSRHSTGVLSTSAILLIRRVIVTIGSAVATGVIARSLTTESFGIYASALAAFYLAQAFCDLGFSAVLARELAVHTDGRPGLLRAAMRPATAWSVLVAIGLVVFTLLTADGDRAQAMLVLTPALAVAGVGLTRQWFMVTYDVRRMATTDLATSLAQIVALIVVAALGGGPMHLALIVCATSVLNTVLIAVSALRRIGPGRPETGSVRSIIMLSLPIGIPSVLASAYFSVDLLLAAYLLPETEVAQYAAAVKLLSLITVLPAILMSAALPGYSAIREQSDPLAFGTLVARTWHWLAAFAFPVCVALACFAPLAARIFFGTQYAGSVDSIRILMAAGVVSLLGNVMGTILVAARRSAVMFYQNMVALILNVGLNLLLLPIYGIEAAAWLTLGTDVFTVLCSILIIRRSLVWRPFFKVTWVPLVAGAVVVAVSLVPAGPDLLRAIIAGLAYLGVMTLLKGWPGELTELLRRRIGRRPKAA